MRNRSLLLAALALSLLALAAPAAALGAVERTVSVEATATIKVPNDSASFGFGVSLERGSRSAALQAVSAKLNRVIAAVQAVPGVGDGDVKTGRISVGKTDPGRYRADEGIGVTLHEPSKAGELVQTAIGAGATGVRGPTYFVGDTEAAYANALGAAFQKAKAKAAALAAQAGATLGAALTINEGGKAGNHPLPGQGRRGPRVRRRCGITSQPAATAQPPRQRASRLRRAADQARRLHRHRHGRRRLRPAVAAALNRTRSPSVRRRPRGGRRRSRAATGSPASAAAGGSGRCRP